MINVHDFAISAFWCVVGAICVLACVFVVVLIVTLVVCAIAGLVSDAKERVMEKRQSNVIITRQEHFVLLNVYRKAHQNNKLIESLLSYLDRYEVEGVVKEPAGSHFRELLNHMIVHDADKENPNDAT